MKHKPLTYAVLFLFVVDAGKDVLQCSVRSMQLESYALVETN